MGEKAVLNKAVDQEPAMLRLVCPSGEAAVCTDGGFWLTPVALSLEERKSFVKQGVVPVVSGVMKSVKMSRQATDGDEFHIRAVEVTRVHFHGVKSPVAVGERIPGSDFEVAAVSFEEDLIQVWIRKAR